MSNTLKPDPFLTRASLLQQKIKETKGEGAPLVRVRFGVSKGNGTENPSVLVKFNSPKKLIQVGDISIKACYEMSEFLN